MTTYGMRRVLRLGCDEALIAAVDPMQTIAAQAGPQVREVADAVREKLSRVLERLV